MRKPGLGLLLLASTAGRSAPFLKEPPPSSPPAVSTTPAILVGAGALFLILLVVFIVRLSKPRPKAMSAAAAARASMSLGARIIVDRGPDRGKEFSLYKAVTKIGRPGARKNDIELEDDTVSKEQAAIYYDDSRKTFSIANESATNPTLADGRPISGPTPVESDAVIAMGRTILRFKKP
jgi:hypothetical protein